MKIYKISATLLASFEVEAASREEAERILRPILEGGKITVTEDADNEESVTGICDVEGELEFKAILKPLR